MSELLKPLEEKIAYLERHVAEQDKVMLELGGDLVRLRMEVQKLRDRLTTSAAGEGGGAPTDERPPHY